MRNCLLLIKLFLGVIDPGIVGLCKQYIKLLPGKPSQPNVTLGFVNKGAPFYLLYQYVKYADILLNELCIHLKLVNTPLQIIK